MLTQDGTTRWCSVKISNGLKRVGIEKLGVKILEEVLSLAAEKANKIGLSN